MGIPSDGEAGARGGGENYLEGRGGRIIKLG